VRERIREFYVRSARISTQAMELLFQLGARAYLVEARSGCG